MLFEELSMRAKRTHEANNHINFFKAKINYSPISLKSQSKKAKLRLIDTRKTHNDSNEDHSFQWLITSKLRIMYM